MDLRWFADDEALWQALGNITHQDFSEGTVIYESPVAGLPLAKFPISNDTVFPMDIPAEWSRVL